MLFPALKGWRTNEQKAEEWSTVAIVRSVRQWSCVSQDTEYDAQKLHCFKQTSGKVKVRRSLKFQSKFLIREVPALWNLRTDLQERLQDKSDAPASPRAQVPLLHLLLILRRKLTDANSSNKKRWKGDQHEETHGSNQQNTKFQKKMTTRIFRVVSCKVCQIGYSCSRMIWLLKASQDIDMLPVLLMNYQSPWWRMRVSTFSSIRCGCTRFGNSMDPSVSLETQMSLQKVLAPTRKPKVIDTDSSLEFGKACEELTWNRCTWTLHRSETNEIGDIAVRRVKEGTLSVLLQSSLDEKWSVDFTYLWNIQDLLSDGKTPYGRRFGIPFKGQTIPFGSLVEYHPITAKDQWRIHQFGKKVLPGLFLGYALYAWEIWKGDVLIADLAELETMDASEIYSKRLNAKEVIFPKQGEFICPIADGRIKTPGGDQELRTSTLIRPRPIRGEGNIDFLGESEGSLPQPQDSFPDAGEGINDFWSMSGSFTLTNKKFMENLRHSAANESEDTNDVFSFPTGYEPKAHDFYELLNSRALLSSTTPTADRDYDNSTLEDKLYRAHRAQVDHSGREDLSVSLSSSSMFDRTRRLVGYRPGRLGEHRSSEAQIRTLLDEHKQKVLAECQARIRQHEFQAAQAEEEQRILQGLLWKQKLEFREAHQRGLTEMEELRKFQSSAFDT